MFKVSGFTKKMDRNLTLMKFDQEPCQLVIMRLMTLPSDPCHSGGVLTKINWTETYP